MGRVDGKVALISGGAGAWAPRMRGCSSTRAAKVVIGDILDDEGKALADDIGDAVRYVHLDVTQPDAVAGRGRHRRQRVRQAQRAGEQRGHRRAGPAEEVRSGRVAEGHRRQPHGHVPRHAGGGPTHDRCRRRFDHQRVVDRGPARRPVRASVRGIQVGGARTGQVGCTRVGAQEHSCQLDPSRASSARR